MHHPTKRFILTLALTLAVAFGIAPAPVGAIPASADSRASISPGEVAEAAKLAAEHGGDLVNFVSETFKWGNGHGSYHDITWSGPHLEIDPVSREERVFFRVRSDARGRDPNSGTVTIPMGRFFDSWDASTVSLYVESDGVKHPERIIKGRQAVERRHTVDATTVTVTHEVFFRARWAHFGVAFPTTRAYVNGVLKPAYRAVAIQN